MALCSLAAGKQHNGIETNKVILGKWGYEPIKFSFQYFLFIEVTPMPLCFEYTPKVIRKITRRRVWCKISGRKLGEI